MTEATMPWWETTLLSDMSREQWEQLCDRCGKCCLIKLQDDETDEVFYTDIVCRYLDADSCGCTQYQRRQVLVPECVELTKENLKDINWMPPSCSYRRILEGRGLADWHHLHSNDVERIHQAGQSIRGRFMYEPNEPDDSELDYEEHIVSWPITEKN